MEPIRPSVASRPPAGQRRGAGALLLVLACGVAACGQKGPLVLPKAPAAAAAASAPSTP